MIRLTVKQWCVLVAVLCGTYLFGMVFRCISDEGLSKGVRSFDDVLLAVLLNVIWLGIVYGWFWLFFGDALFGNDESDD